jgi:hypothetical protein
MSTRGCIARVSGDGFRGVYHHWDSYPTALGKDLFGLAQENDLGDMLRELIDDHPAGWLQIREECICHGQNGEGPLVVTDQENSTWVIWAYAFDEAARTMGVFRHLPSQAWTLCAVLLIDGPSPDWRLIEAKGDAAAR